MRIFLILFVLLPLFYTCDNNQLKDNITKDNQDKLLMSVLWYQKSPEMQAMYYQCYNTAKLSLTENLRISEDKRPKAVIMDIDETILDNSPVEAYQIINNVSYSDSLWKIWTDLAIAEPLPGALDFTMFTQSRGVEVFMCQTEAKTWHLETTLSNLMEKGFPFADSLHLILKTSTSSKEERRQSISARFEILLFIGDNLGDFDSVFDSREEDLAFGSVRQNRNIFGNKFIILPNPMYGPWLNAAIGNSAGNTQKEKLLKALVAF